MEFVGVEAGWIKKLKLRVPAIGLFAATLLFWGNYDRYEPISEPLLEFPVLGNALRLRGDASQTNKVICLHVPEGGKTAEARFQILEEPACSEIRVQGRIRTEGVVRGKYRWSSARLLLIQRDEKGKWIPGTHGLLDEEGTVPWTFQQQEFDVFPEARTVEVVLQQIGESGTAWFDEITAVPVELKGSYMPFRFMFAAAWVFLAFLYFRRCRLDHRKLRILILLNVMAILYGTLIPTIWIQKSVDGFKERLGQIQEHQIEKKAESKQPALQEPQKKLAPKTEANGESKAVGGLIELVEKVHHVGHFILFAMLCFLVYCSAALEGQSRAYYIKVAFDILLFAAVSESLQYLTLDRTPGFSDWLTDVYGMILALLLFLIIRPIVPFFPKSGKA